MGIRIDRRQALLGAGALIGLGVAGPLRAEAEGNGWEALVDDFTGGVIPQEGRIVLDLPEVAENGASVPLALRVDSPMTDDDHVRRVLVVAGANPAPKVAEFRFSALSGTAEVATRIRLGSSQRVIAVAEMSDGSFHTARRMVQVTIGGCVG